LVNRELDAAVAQLSGEGLDPKRLARAADLVRTVALSDRLPDFLTLIAEQQLD
jgi:hypothetical protein